MQEQEGLKKRKGLRKMLSDFPCRKHLSFLCGSARLTCLAADAQLRRILRDALKSCCFYLYERFCLFLHTQMNEHSNYDAYRTFTSDPVCPIS